MAKISKYNPVTSPGDTDAIPIVQGGVTKKALLSVLKTYFNLGESAAPTPTAANDFQVAAGSPLAWAKKTLAETLVILGIASKADKVATSPAPTGLVATYDSDGNLSTSAIEVEDIVVSEDITTIVKLTQAQYTALSPADSATLYIIVAA